MYNAQEKKHILSDILKLKITNYDEATAAG